MEINRAARTPPILPHPNTVPGVSDNLVADFMDLPVVADRTAVSFAAC
ncbi:hypothetical protein [Actinomadura sp. 7K534]|nr:hypothetical protein [Actinomadura sp. 7K534]